MNNDELKKKMIKIIEENISWETDVFTFRKLANFSKEELPKLADALIAKGIGDVSEYKHRAEVAERALRIACGNITKELWQDWHASWRTRNYYDDMIKQAEKELAEERKDEN